MNKNKEETGTDTLLGEGASEDNTSVGSEASGPEAIAPEAPAAEPETPAVDNSGSDVAEEIYVSSSLVSTTETIEAKTLVARFNTVLTIYVRTTRESMQALREAAELALKHFEQHGDVSLIERVELTMPKNYARRAAFLKWAKAFSPLAKINGKLAKDKSEKAKPFNLEAAFKEPFWEFAPDMEQVAWDMTKVVDMLTKTVNKFVNGSGFNDPTPEQMADLAVVREHISLLPQVIQQRRNKVVAPAPAPATDGKAAA